MSVEYKGRGGPDGTTVFQSGEKGSFFGATPVVQPTSASQAAVTLTAVTAVATTAATTGAAIHGYTTNTQADKIPTLLNQLRVDVTAMNVLLTQVRAELVTLGLIAGS